MTKAESLREDFTAAVERLSEVLALPGRPIAESVII